LELVTTVTVAGPLESATFGVSLTILLMSDSFVVVAEVTPKLYSVPFVSDVIVYSLPVIFSPVALPSIWLPLLIVRSSPSL